MQPNIQLPLTRIRGDCSQTSLFSNIPDRSPTLHGSSVAAPTPHTAWLLQATHHCTQHTARRSSRSDCLRLSFCEQPTTSHREHLHGTCTSRDSTHTTPLRRSVLDHPYFQHTNHTAPTAPLSTVFTGLLRRFICCCFYLFDDQDSFF